MLRPNILLLNDGYLLIDHELSLPVNETILSGLLHNEWIYPYKQHIFYPYLKKAKASNKRKFFETFFECLRLLNANALDIYARKLSEFDHPTGDYDFVKHYLYQLKNNKTLFIEQLKGAIA